MPALNFDGLPMGPFLLRDTMSPRRQVERLTAFIHAARDAMQGRRVHHAFLNNRDHR